MWGVGVGRESKFFPLDAKQDLHIVGQCLKKKTQKLGVSMFNTTKSIFSEININIINGAILQALSLKLGTRQGLTH